MKNSLSFLFFPFCMQRDYNVRCGIGLGKIVFYRSSYKETFLHLKKRIRKKKDYASFHYFKKDSTPLFFKPKQKTREVCHSSKLSFFSNNTNSEQGARF